MPSHQHFLYSTTCRKLALGNHDPSSITQPLSTLTGMEMYSALLNYWPHGVGSTGDAIYASSDGLSHWLRFKP